MPSRVWQSAQESMTDEASSTTAGGQLTVRRAAFSWRLVQWRQFWWSRISGCRACAGSVVRRARKRRRASVREPDSGQTPSRARGLGLAPTGAGGGGAEVVSAPHWHSFVARV